MNENKPLIIFVSNVNINHLIYTELQTAIFGLSLATFLHSPYPSFAYFFVEMIVSHVLDPVVGCLAKLSW